MRRGPEKRESIIDPATVASIQTVFQRSQLSYNAWRSRVFEGRIDSRNVWRNDAQDVTDIFREKRGQSATKVNVWLLIDASGSMRSGANVHAQNLTATLAEAFKRIRSVKFYIWQHDFNYIGGEGTTRLRRVYEPGMDLRNIDTMANYMGSGNADGFALKAIGERALRVARKDERTIIVIISDGEPTDEGKGATNHNLQQFSWTVSEDLRKRGAHVYCVAVEQEKSYAYSMYGEENVVPFKYGKSSAWSDLARGLADIFGKALRK